MNRLSWPARALSLTTLFACWLSPLTAQAPRQPAVTRVSATLNGVFSPRGFFNVLVPLRDMPGVSAAKLDLKPSHITVDFTGKVPVSREEIRRVMIEAGYRPGNIQIQRLPGAIARETGPGWIRIKHLRTSNPVKHWFEENF